MTPNSTLALLFSTIFLVIFVPVLIACYLFFCWVNSRIGRKFGIGSFGRFCIPVYNSVLLCRCAGISGWNVLWMFIPLANLIFVVFLWGTIAERLRHNFWAYGLGVFLFAIPIFVLAFDSSTFERIRNGGEQFGPSVYCIAGEYQGNRMYIDVDGLVIGRDPSQAHLILSSPEISAAHVRIWPDHNGSGVWVQDMRSINGTFYKESDRSGLSQHWMEVSQPTLITAGAHIRLGDSVAEFLVS